MNGTTVKFN